MLFDDLSISLAWALAVALDAGRRGTGHWASIFALPSLPSSAQISYLSSVVGGRESFRM